MRPDETTLTEMSGLTEVGLTEEAVFEEQRKYVYCRRKVEEIKAQQELGFLLNTDGLLYKGDKLSEAKLVVPETLVREVIQMHHDKVFCRTPGY